MYLNNEHVNTIALGEPVAMDLRVRHLSNSAIYHSCQYTCIQYIYHVHIYSIRICAYYNMHKFKQTVFFWGLRPTSTILATSRDPMLFSATQVNLAWSAMPTLRISTWSLLFRYRTRSLVCSGAPSFSHSIFGLGLPITGHSRETVPPACILHTYCRLPLGVRRGASAMRNDVFSAN